MLFYVEAIASSVLFNLSLVVQAIDAKKAPSDLGMKPGLLFHLMRRKLWMLGNLMNIASAILQIRALERLPIALVQSISAGGILLVPLSARWILRERPQGKDLIALVVIISGLGLAMASTPPQDAHLTLSPWTLFGVTLAVSLASVVAAKRYTALAAGICFGAATVISKVLALDDTTGVRLIAAAVALLGISGGTGFLAQTTALQTMSPTRVGPLVLATSTALPILLAPFLFAEHWPAPHLTILATCVVIGAAAWIASKPLTPMLEGRA
jgi:drug/metabolite transporter (DMT)-like permease